MTGAPSEDPANPAIVHGVPVRNVVDGFNETGRHLSVSAAHYYPATLGVRLRQKRAEQRLQRLRMGDIKEFCGFLWASRSPQRANAVLNFHVLKPLSNQQFTGVSETARRRESGRGPSGNRSCVAKWRTCGWPNSIWLTLAALSDHRSWSGP